ncbi:hypothetical protein EJB05_24761 [Eragrostis curvula]|uniref:Uncharacterized protein n=1 Tax=Eragrostis curvula TaxID=38414 RepID=A0A5J9VAC0_9POAL|nr:hypothetical protein EJB05_24761 [Eragrostis curvula]
MSHALILAAKKGSNGSQGHGLAVSASQARDSKIEGRLLNELVEGQSGSKVQRPLLGVYAIDETLPPIIWKVTIYYCEFQRASSL